MIALSLGVHGALIQRPTSSVLVRLPAKVTRQLPCDGRLIAVGESVRQDAARVFHFVGPDLAVFVEAHVIDEDGEDIYFAVG